MNDKQYTQQRQSATVKRCVRCPIHRAVIGKYDPRVGLINATFYARNAARNTPTRYRPASREKNFLKYLNEKLLTLYRKRSYNTDKLNTRTTTPRGECAAIALYCRPFGRVRRWCLIVALSTADAVSAPRLSFNRHIKKT